MNSPWHTLSKKNQAVQESSAGSTPNSSGYHQKPSQEQSLLCKDRKDGNKRCSDLSVGELTFGIGMTLDIFQRRGNVEKVRIKLNS
jgi:hypothetical protein